MLHGLDLFSGIGGISLALRPWVRTIAYCEIDRYCQGVLLSRMLSGDLDRAPIWDDIRTLAPSMLSGELPDIITGGFPCQDISCAGNGAGLEGQRSGLFFEIARLVGDIRPSFVFLENVPAISVRGLDRVTATLAALGYDSRWDCLRAYDVGAPHLRERWWLYSHRNSARFGGESQLHGSPLLQKETQHGNHSDRLRDAISNSNCQHLWDSEQRQARGRDDVQDSGRTLTGYHGENGPMANAYGRRRTEGWREPEVRQGQSDPFSASGRQAESGLGGSSDGLSGWLERGGGLDDGEAEETGAAEAMRYLRQDHVSQAVRHAIGGSIPLRCEEILFLVMREYARGGRIPRQFLASEATPKGLLRAMRSNREASGASQRPRQVEQYFREYPDALRLLSRMVASRDPTPWTDHLWESALPRVAGSVPKRVDRLRGLGNAVVPAQAREAFVRLSGLKDMLRTQP